MGQGICPLGAAQQSNGHLLDAADSYKKALTAEDRFTGCRKAYNELITSRRYCKLALIREAQQNEEGYAKYLEYEATNENNAIASMNDNQKGILAMIRSGRVFPKGIGAKEVKEQDLILYLTALDAGILIQSNFTVSNGKHAYTCAGTRSLLICQAKDGTLKCKNGDPLRNVDIYKQLLDVDSEDGTYEVFWQHVPGCSAETILLCRNQDFEDREQIVPPGLDIQDPMGPTVAYNQYQTPSDVMCDPYMKFNAVFLISLNFFFLVKAETDALKWGFEPNAFGWDIAKQRFTRIDDGRKLAIFYGTSQLLTEHFQFWCYNDFPQESFVQYNPHI
mmetsp:Transcript_25784/g.56550  ORF Transcript_25784/g.56550 Transcript_25784/m.56550 type:complete len:333 (-) Transcript_25784:220-1218(-)